jgi:S-adenosylmethionine hydrolase
MAGGAERAVVLTNPDYQLDAPGATFAGRDVFAPAAAHLCNGVELTELGPEVDPALLLPAPCRCRVRRATRSSPRSCGSTGSATHS